MYDAEREAEKYSWLYENGYGVGPVRQVFNLVKNAVGNTAEKTVIDAGCGHAELSKVTSWMSYTGADLATSQVERLSSSLTKPVWCRFLEADVTRLGFETKSFDVAWCCDVLEHVPTEYVAKALAELCRVGRLVVVSVCCRPSGILSREGENLHLTVRDQAWWKRVVSRFGEIVQETVFGDNVVFVVKARDDLENLLSFSAAIVGNGPGELGRGLGETIDAFDKVVRFNNFDVSEKFNQDYGRRTDVWVTSFWHNIKRPLTVVDRVLCPFPLLTKNERWKARYTFNETLFNEFTDRMIVVDDESFQKTCSLCNDPSTGMALLCWLYEKRGFVDPDATFGFGFFARDEKHHYQDGEVKHDGHDGDSEKKLYEKMLVNDV